LSMEFLPLIVPS